MDPFLSAFRAHAAADPACAACVSPARVRTRGDLAAQVESAATELAGRGVGPGAVVALSAPPGPAFVAAWLALRAREACALLIDSDAAPRERQRVVQHLGAGQLWVIEEAFDDAPLPGELTNAGTPSRACLPEISTLKLTSGSTGLPSGVAVRASELLADSHNLIATMGLSGADRFLCTIPFSHSYGFSLLPASHCLLGARLLLPEGRDPLEVARLLGATVLPSVPAWFQARLGHSGESTLPEHLRLCISAGAQLSPRTARAWREQFGRPIHVFYGSSECGGITFDRVGDAAERGSVGTPVDNVRVELGPMRAGEPLGIVRVSSEAVASGYHPADPERDARLGLGWFETEDLGRFEGGELLLRGRHSRWINVKGLKVDPREVEQALEDLPGLRDVVIVAQVLPTGHGEALRAIVACDEGALRYQDVVAWCRSRLAAHKVPRSVVLVHDLPRNERGKLDRQALDAL
ncbi:MAG TPA: class I adenylate-forming enzyme family protein [Planctomycetota bacterium]|nr:class I adenylate-forming enzyme family protein [Planctomycetota bacterium]